MMRASHMMFPAECVEQTSHPCERSEQHHLRALRENIICRHRRHHPWVFAVYYYTMWNEIRGKVYEREQTRRYVHVFFCSDHRSCKRTQIQTWNDNLQSTYMRPTMPKGQEILSPSLKSHWKKLAKQAIGSIFCTGHTTLTRRNINRWTACALPFESCWFPLVEQ